MRIGEPNRQFGETNAGPHLDPEAAHDLAYPNPAPAFVDATISSINRHMLPAR